jgi:hypothetical protein
LVANTLGLPFFNVKASEIVSHFTGVSTICFSKLSHVVRQAGGVVFIDEGELLLQDRNFQPGGGGEESVVSAFKQLFQDKPDDPIVMVATNAPEAIRDSGTLRRLGLKLYVGLPDAKTRISLIISSLRRYYPHDYCDRYRPEGRRLTDILRALEDSTTSGPRRALIDYSAGYTPAEISSIVKSICTHHPVGIENLSKLQFCQVENTTLLGPTRRPAVYIPRLLGSEEPCVTRSGDTRLRQQPVPVVSVGTVESDTNALICWPVISLSELIRGFENPRSTGVKRSVGLDSLQKFITYSENVLSDPEGAQRIIADYQEIARVVRTKSPGTSPIF